MSLDTLCNEAKYLQFYKSKMRLLLFTTRGDLLTCRRRPTEKRESRIGIIAALVVFAVSTFIQLFLFFFTDAISDRFRLFWGIFRCGGLLALAVWMLSLSLRLFGGKKDITGSTKIFREFQETAEKIVGGLKATETRLRSAYPEWEFSAEYGNYYELYLGIFSQFISHNEISGESLQKRLKENENGKKKSAKGKWMAIAVCVLPIIPIIMLFPELFEFDVITRVYDILLILMTVFMEVLLLMSVRWIASYSAYHKTWDALSFFYFSFEANYYTLEDNLNRLNYLYLAEAKETKKNF